MPEKPEHSSQLDDPQRSKADIRKMPTTTGRKRGTGLAR